MSDVVGGGTRFPTPQEAASFKTAVLGEAAKWLESRRGLDRSQFSVEVSVNYLQHATEDLYDYFQRDTGDEAK